MSETSSTGFDPKFAGLLAYLLGIVSGILLLIVEKESPFVRFHAAQSTVVFGLVLVLSLMVRGLPLVGRVLWVPFVVGVAALWVVLMIKAIQGQRFKLPYLGDFAERQLV